MKRSSGQAAMILERRMAQRCLCFNVRKAARAVTQLYDAAFRPLGIKATQATLLFSIMAMGPVPLSRLAAHAVLDRTSLTRNLRPLIDAGLIELTAGQDGRVRLAQLTDRGAVLARAALPIWDDVQDRMAGTFGDTGLDRTLGELSSIVESIQTLA